MDPTQGTAVTAAPSDVSEKTYPKCSRNHMITTFLVIVCLFLVALSGEKVDYAISISVFFCG